MKTDILNETYQDVIVEGKLEDFIEQNKLSKEKSLDPENIKKLKKILKLSGEKTKAKLEKYWTRHSDEKPADKPEEEEAEPKDSPDMPAPGSDSSTSDSDSKKSEEDSDSKPDDPSTGIDIPSDVDTEVSKLNPKLKKLFGSAMNMISKQVKDYAKDQTGDLLDELFAGNFHDAMIRIYDENVANDMDEETAAKKFEELKNSDEYKTAEDKFNAETRKDTNENADVDENNAKFSAMWYSNKKENNIGAMLSQIVKEIQQKATKLQGEVEKLKKELKSAHIDIDDKELSNFAPALLKAMNDGAKAKDYEKLIGKLRKQVKESMTAKLTEAGYRGINESFETLDESVVEPLLFEAICENDIIRESIAGRLVDEGILSGIKNAFSKVADIGGKALKIIKQNSIMPILQLCGVAVGVFTGGLEAELIIKTMDLIEKQGKNISNALERAAARYANSKGVITKMDFVIQAGEADEAEEIKYSARFYDKDKVWRVLNLNDQLKHPSISYAKKILDGDVGKKYRERLRAVWDPIFSESRGGKIDFVELFKAAKSLKINPKTLDLFKKFTEEYDEISSSCIDKPRIDTRR